jgi:hypothetical protein
MANKVERWEYDGRLYESEELANYAENQDKVIEYMDENPLFVSQKGRVKAQEIMLWLRMSCPRVFIQLLPENKNGD